MLGLRLIDRLPVMQKTLFTSAILLWFIGLAAVIATSFALRTYFGLPGLGMPEGVWFASHSLLCVTSIIMMLFSIKGERLLKKIAYVSFAVAVGGIYYLASIWIYVIESGIDST